MEGALGDDLGRGGGQQPPLRVVRRPEQVAQEAEGRIRPQPAAVGRHEGVEVRIVRQRRLAPAAGGVADSFFPFSFVFFLFPCYLLRPCICFRFCFGYCVIHCVIHCVVDSTASPSLRLVKGRREGRRGR